MYRVGPKAQKEIDGVFDKLHHEGKITWATDGQPTRCQLPTFVIYKPATRVNPQTGETEKYQYSRPVVDCRPLNQHLLPDRYPMPSQDDIIQLAQGKKFITVIDAAKFFYQWRVHPDDVDLQSVISHRGQERLHVVVMGNVNSVAYVQCQIDNILREFRPWCRAYVDDIVVVSDTIQQHVERLDRVLATLARYNICLDPKKAKIGFPSLTLLGRTIDSLGLSTKDDKLAAIRSLPFPRTCKHLETYLGMCGDLRHFIQGYAAKAAPLQQRKTDLLRGSPIKGAPRRKWAASAQLLKTHQCRATEFPHATERVRCPKVASTPRSEQAAIHQDR